MELLHRAVSQLAAVCDGAHSQDGQGFNGTDAVFGKQLAATPFEAWSPQNKRAAWEILKKYTNQLHSFGIAYNAIPVPENVTASRHVNVIDSANGRYILRFHYDPAVIEAIKSKIKGARWNPTDKVWTAPLDQKEPIERIAEVFDFTWTEAARNPEPVLHLVTEKLGTVTVEHDELVLKFDYDADAVAAVRLLQGRRWDNNAKCWIVPTSEIKGVKQFAEKFNLTVSAEAAAIKEVEEVTTFTVSCNGEHFILRFPYTPEVIEQIRDIPTARYNHVARVWTVQVHAGVELLEVLLKMDGVQAEENAIQPLAAAQLALDQIESSRAHDAEIVIDGLGGELMPFQRAGVAYALRAKRTFIADEMGLGKTVQAIATLHASDAFPALIICPASLKLNWQREIRKWIPNVTTEILSGTKSRTTTADVRIINYDILHAWAESFTDLKGLVLDESHYIKNATTRRAKAAIELSDRVDPEGTVLCLTGTPVLNNASELIPQIRVIGRLKEFGGVKEFRRRYGYGLNLTELNRKLRATCYVRRRKSEVLTELPPKRWSSIVVEGDPTVMKEYREAEQNLIAYLATKAREFALAEGATDMQAREAAWQAQMRAQAAEHLVAVTNLKKIAARAKMKAAEEWIADFLESGKKLVAFGWHRATVDMVAEQFARGVKVQGGMDDAARQASVDAFQTDDDQKVISCSIRAAGVGLTLTAASDVLFLEQGWTPADMDQAADRCHRIGQTDSVTAWTLLCADTIDEYIADIIAEKRSLVDAATEGGDDQQQASVLGDLLIRLASRGMAG